jgi:hypothetical protein
MAIARFASHFFESSVYAVLALAKSRTKTKHFVVSASEAPKHAPTNLALSSCGTLASNRRCGRSIDRRPGDGTETGGKMASKMFKFSALTAALLTTGAVYAQTPSGAANAQSGAMPDRMEGRPDAGSQPHRGIYGPRPGDRSPGDRAAPAEKSGAP